VLVGDYQSSHDHSIPLTLPTPLCRKEGQGPSRLPERRHPGPDRSRVHLLRDVEGDPEVLRICGTGGAVEQVDYLGRYGEEDVPHARGGSRPSLAVNVDS